MEIRIKDDFDIKKSSTVGNVSVQKRFRRGFTVLSSAKIFCTSAAAKAFLMSIARRKNGKMYGKITLIWRRTTQKFAAT